jgi:hypothetical protein
MHLDLGQSAKFTFQNGFAILTIAHDSQSFGVAALCWTLGTLARFSLSLAVL